MKRVFRTRYFMLQLFVLVGIALNQSCSESLDVVEPVDSRMHQTEVESPSDTSSVSDYFQQVLKSKTPGYYVYASLLEACGLLPELAKIEDEEYYRQRMIGNIKDLEAHPTFYSAPGVIPEHRYYGFTLFLEGDEWWSQALGMSSLCDMEPKEIVKMVSAYVVENQLHLPGASTEENYTDENNALNQFVTYHIIPAKIEPNKLVIHYNELYYSVANQAKLTSVFDYYTTMGKRRLLKTFEPSQVSGDGRRDVVFLNRFPELDNGRHGRYTERWCDEDKKGAEIQSNKEFVNAQIYDINNVLYFNHEVANNMSSERIRIDAASIFKELMSNGIRANESTADRTKQCVGIPKTEAYSYLEDCEIGDNTLFYYLSGRVSNDGSTCWINYQGDEFNIVGNSEITIKLPPVPKDGTYELRMGVSANSQRGMFQIYWGTNKDRLPAIGSPIDMRMGGVYWYNQFGHHGGGEPSTLGWEDDIEDEDMINAEIDKRLRNNGYMKGPNSFWMWTRSATSDISTQHARRRGDSLRKILLTEEMRADKTYYLRFKSVLPNNRTEFYLDYLEFCESNVYDSLVQPEDIW